MEETIRNFPKQFEYNPVIENEAKLQRTGKYLLCGMGGSHLQGDIFQSVLPGFDLSVYQDYGLPCWPEEALKKTLIIASSYSGNTEETVSGFQEALEKGYSLVVISTGGKLLEMAKEKGIPYVQIPDTGIQPRSALGFTFKALAKVVGRDDLVRQAGELAGILKPDVLEQEGKELIKHFEGKIPLIYGSNRNYAIAYNWKIKFNETGKIPAFYNIFPELNHNEMNGFDVTERTKELTNAFFFFFIRDAEDHPRIQKRIAVLHEQLYQRGFPVMLIDLEGSSRLERIFSCLLLADWLAFYIAKFYGRDPEKVPMIEEFKKMMSS
ncbi:MAG: bifunctional phosphoglucose/phosphomannose isomerase [Candidatus Wildermuthbacteria bacterium RIFCSPHIGHO2_12_FULL_45_9]|uniref:Bifunctional phosphoglucose/phosphomannose isomerase n=1 Tax=Candidatus Wildermuthbacteria bacterium RIFCSPHIGHO2_02_FULL_45_25 TaxID=1802450 RepID=A0A1G2QYM0_9BACT|nr:MAG: bifunctional phosphoglucose/phosphomannose isomerase [Candidatus Wildermuthbacteria bacterium RIFCSPHIGHO2_01_FULL_45_20]OHA65623.1 MAG: bifunctional phosphoglucose/phosphomannose isomerase [Candidatus Wildermuthbacteria bacterium RIFCSPHIGHO2_02_FULL_45_25]OHA71078.1 MAG: bifunctional phosphoglucose/phosphomannose isomerase [Candidatus Wildermuthbacteria bacterium RIFCSPHIGHO2_12_FULL_45_9]